MLPPPAAPAAGVGLNAPLAVELPVGWEAEAIAVDEKLSSPEALPRLADGPPVPLILGEAELVPLGVALVAALPLPNEPLGKALCDGDGESVGIATLAVEVPTLALGESIPLLDAPLLPLAAPATEGVALPKGDPESSGVAEVDAVTLPVVDAAHQLGVDSGEREPDALAQPLADTCALAALLSVAPPLTEGPPLAVVLDVVLIEAEAQGVGEPLAVAQAPDADAVERMESVETRLREDMPLGEATGESEPPPPPPPPLALGEALPALLIEAAVLAEFNTPVALGGGEVLLLGAALTVEA